MARACVALIGGGRWGRVHASVLARMSSRIDRILWVTRHNKSAVDAFLAQRADVTTPRFNACASLDAALAERPTAAIVVNAASDHASTADRVLRSGVPTLVEKPLALNSQVAEELVELAEQRNLVLCVALHLLKAEFLQDFRRTWAGRSVKGINVEWLDPAYETRHGETKSANLATHKVDEVVPHLWSILSLMLEGHEPQIRAVKPQPLGAVALEIDIGPARATALLARRAAGRRRRIELVFADGGSASLDFVREPGDITIDGVRQRRDAMEGNRPGPLVAEIHDFLDVVSRPQDRSSCPQLARRCLGSVVLAETVRERLIEAEARAVAALLAAGGAVQGADISAWIIDNVAPQLGAMGMHIAATDYATQTQIVQMAQQTIDHGARSWPKLRCSETSHAIASIGRDSRFLALVAKYRAREKR